MKQFYHLLIMGAAVAGCAFSIPGREQPDHQVSSRQIGSALRGDLPRILTVSFRKDTFNIVKFGAKADGITLNARPIQGAIEACSHNGGGTVLIPAGMWL